MSDAGSALVALLNELGIRTRRVGCVRCKTEWDQLRAGEHWAPECPRCTAVIRVQVEATSPTPSLDHVAYRGNILDDLQKSGVNVHKYGDATLAAAADSSDPGALIHFDPHALQIADQWIQEHWVSPAPRRYRARDWMYLFGDESSREGGKVQLGKLGNGKTYLAIAIARSIIERGILRPDRFRFATAEMIQLESEATFRGNDDSEKALLRRYERPDLLIIDDIGVRESLTPHAVRLFDELTKLREAKATIWTGNLSIPVLTGAAEYMRRVCDRITGECGEGARYVVRFTGPSRRIARSRRKVST